MNRTLYICDPIHVHGFDVTYDTPAKKYKCTAEIYNDKLSIKYK